MHRNNGAKGEVRVSLVYPDLGIAFLQDERLVVDNLEGDAVIGRLVRHAEIERLPRRQVQFVRLSDELQPPEHQKTEPVADIAHERVGEWHGDRNETDEGAERGGGQ